MTATALEPRTLAYKQWDTEFARLVKLTVLQPKGREATSAELAMFAEQVQRTGLDPFLGQIYGIYRKQKDGTQRMTVQVGIDGFRLQAERNGKYQGQTPVEWCDEKGVWTDVWLKPGNPSAARAGVYKLGHSQPTYAVAHWKEYVDGNSPMWKSMPANQLAKCAEALALRKCFPAELSGLYTPEEMDQAERDAPPPVVVVNEAQAGGHASQEDVQRLVEFAESAVKAKILTAKKLTMQLVDRGATDTSTVQAAAESMSAAAVEQLASEFADQLAAKEEADAAKAAQDAAEKGDDQGEGKDGAK